MNELSAVQRVEQRHKVIIAVKRRSLVRFLEYAFRGVLENFVILPFGVVADYGISLFQIRYAVAGDLDTVEAQIPNFLKQDFKIREIPFGRAVLSPLVGFLYVGV